MTAQASELSARLIDLFGSPATADPTKLYGNLTMNPNGTVQVGTGLILPDGYTRALTDMGRNRIINGGMDIWQRSTSITTTLSGYQAADRFGCSTVGSNTIALSSDVPNNAFAYSLKLTVGTGASPAAGAFNGVWHNIEGYNVIDFAYGTSKAQVGVLTFWVKASIAGSYAIGFMNAALNRNYITTYTVSNANTWQQVSVVIAGDQAGTWNNQNLTGLSICWDLGSGSTYQTATLNTWQAGQMYGTAASTKLIATTGATLQLTGVQFELGSYNSPFERRMMATELQNCFRYYERLSGGPYGVGGANGSTGGYIMVPWTTAKRVSPSIGLTAASSFYCWSSSTANIVLSSISATYTCPTTALFTIGFASGGTGGQAMVLQNQSSSYIEVISEL
jgi:hypothetical protein